MVLALSKGPEHPTKLALFFKINKFKKIKKKSKKKSCVFCDSDFFLGTPIPGYRGFRRPAADDQNVFQLFCTLTIALRPTTFSTASIVAQFVSQSMPMPNLQTMVVHLRMGFD